MKSCNHKKPCAQCGLSNLSTAFSICPTILRSRIPPHLGKPPRESQQRGKWFHGSSTGGGGGDFRLWSSSWFTHSAPSSALRLVPRCMWANSPEETEGGRRRGHPRPYGTGNAAQRPSLELMKWKGKKVSPFLPKMTAAGDDDAACSEGDRGRT